MQTHLPTDFQTPSPHRPTLSELLKTFLALGFISFGPGMFALIHQRVVEQKAWLSEDEFREAVTFSELAPGPFTLHVVMYLGYHLRGLLGLVLCTLFFSLPSIALVVTIALYYQDLLAQIPGLEYFMMGVWAAIMASMFSTVIHIGRHVFHSPFLIVLAMGTFFLVVFFKMSFFVLIFLCGVIAVIVGVIR